jgi:hypothetical protein
MKTSQFLLNITIFALFAFNTVAVEVTNIPTPIFNWMPKDTQGTNGIRLQYRDVNTTNYTDLAYAHDYTWITPGTPNNIPLVGALSSNKWAVQPSAVLNNQYNRDSVIRVRIDGQATRILIQGATGTDNSTSVLFYIYTGETNWGSPLWSGGPGSDFLITNNWKAGDELLFACNALGNDVNDWAWYQNLTLTGLKFPPQRPKVDIRTSQVELCWNTEPDAWYQLQYQSSLYADQWLPLHDWVSGDGNRYCTSDAILIGEPERFYRVIVTNSLPLP